MFACNPKTIFFWGGLLLASVLQAQEEPEIPIAVEETLGTEAASYEPPALGTPGFETPCQACLASAASKPSPCVSSHKGVFYNNDFKYLNDPANTACCLGDRLKQLHLTPWGPCGPHGKFDIGGQFRLRYHNENGMKGAQRFLDTEDDFLLSRTRLYANYASCDGLFRVFAEGIYADSHGHSLPARGIDRNHGDLLNAFVDVKLTEELTARVGRQELVYGAQRTVSPLDWANTRRTFEGAKLMLALDQWKVDAFYTHFVPVQPFEFDKADYHRKFYGAYGVYSGLENATLDLYYLGFDNHDANFSLHTFGSRLAGGQGDWLYELEGAYQGGNAGAGVDQNAGFVTAGLGRKLPCTMWSPTAWVYFDYASGGASTTDSHAYNQLFPLAHKYLGFIDAAQRSNMESVNFLLKAKPSEKMSLLAWYYVMQSNAAAPVPSIGGTPTQNAGKDFGQELDLILSYKIAPRSDILFGYSHFWAGGKIANANDADFFYSQWTMNF